jgi:hypothetical protein
MLVDLHLVLHLVKQDLEQVLVEDYPLLSILEIH